MVSTRQADKSRKPAKEGFDPAGSGDGYEGRATESTKTRGIKRARSAKSTAKNKGAEKRRKKANLSRLPEMPIDILYEIFSLVHPKDLLHISWTSKTLNGFLTSKSSRHVWQASFRTVVGREQPPACPSGMTEMAYANLVYGRYCMNCASEKPVITAWNVLMRICGPCVEEIAMNPYDAGPENSMYYAHEMRHILPTFRVRYSDRGLEDKVLCSDSQRFCEEFAATEEGSQKALVEKYKSLTHERTKFSHAMVELGELAEQIKEDARADVQKRRIERIWEKLAEEGWQEEIAARRAEYEPGLLRIKGVKMIRPLGEKAWAELRAPLNAFMEEESARIHARITADRHRSRMGQVKNIVKAFRFSLPHPHDFYPSAADICWVPEVQKAIIDGTDQEFQDCKADIQARISAWSKVWLEERRKVFMQLLPQDSPTVEDLSLATTMFDCAKCRDPGMRIEEALSHRCYSFYNSGPGERLLISTIYRTEVGAPWDSGFSKFKYSAELATLMKGIVLECGENPGTITIREMNRKHHRFVHFGTGGTITVFSWSQLFERKRYGMKDLCRFLRPDELPECTPEPEGAGFWGCIHCWGSGPEELEWYNKSFTEIENHLAASHDIGNPTEGDYFPIDPNYTIPIECRPVTGI